MKQKWNKEKVTCVRTDMFKTDLWLKTRTLVKESKCQNCGRLLKECSGEVALIQVIGELNKWACKDCGEMYINLGAEDISKNVKTLKDAKENIILDIRSLGNYNEREHYSEKLEDLDIKELEEIYTEYKTKKDEQDRIDDIVIPKEDIGMEEYLPIDYGVIEDPEWLKCPEKFKDYPWDDDYFECGQGYFTDTELVIVKIGKKFYEVTITAEIMSSKQDRGDRLYWVEDINTVDYKEIDKPLPKENITFTYTFTMNKDRKSVFDKYLNELNIKVEG